MTQRVDLSLTTTDDDPIRGAIVCRVETLDRSLDGLAAVFSFVAEVEVLESSPVHGKQILYSREIRLSSIPVEIRIPRNEVRAYTYSGRMIRMKLNTRLVVDDAILFDYKISEEQELELGTKPVISAHAQSIIEPSDSFDFFKNLKAIPIQAKLRTVAFAIVGAVLITINTLVGLHDESSLEAATWLYSQVDSDGDRTSPLIQSLGGSGVLGAAVWFAIRRQLRRYMEFNLRKLPQIRRDEAYSVPDLVRGLSRVPLKNVTLRVVACNMELGQYVRGSGTDERTVSFREPTRGVILYENTVANIEPKTQIAQHFTGPVDFTPMFVALYPPFKVSKTHGVDVHWEVQLLHPEFVDQELVGPNDGFLYEDFLEG